MKQQSNYTLGLVMLASVFSGGLVLSAVLASKVAMIGPFVVPAGVLAFSITFLCTDIASEVYGPAVARRIVMGGFATLVLSLLLTQLALAVPGAPFWQNQAGFESVLSSTTRIIVASLVAYLISQFTDVWIFHRLRSVTEGRLLWLRNNASTALSQLLDSAVFIVIAFWGVLPVWEMIVGQWALKLLIALLDTPLVYLGVAWLRGAVGTEATGGPEAA